MALNARRQALLEQVLEEAGWHLESRQTARMQHGDVVETDLWVVTRAGAARTLKITSELTFGAGFPPIIQVLPGRLDLAAAAAAQGEEHVLEDPEEAAVRALVAALTSR